MKLMDQNASCSSFGASFQFELALNIGLELELKPMLSRFFFKALDLLSADAAYVWVRSESVHENLCFSFPDFSEVNAYLPYLKSEIVHISSQNWQNIRSGHQYLLKGESFQLFRLGNIGVMALKSAVTFSDSQIVNLLPVCERLAQACELCLNYEAKLVHQNSTVKALQNTLIDGNFKDQLLRKLSNKIRLSVAEIKKTQSQLAPQRSDVHTVSRRDNDIAASHLEAFSGNLTLVSDELEQYLFIKEECLSYQSQPMALRDTINKVKNIFLSQAKLAGVELKLTMDELVPEEVYGDAKIIELLLSQLIDNALRNTPKGHVKINVIPLEISDEWMRLKVQVADTGRGMEAKKLNHLLNQDIEDIGRSVGAQEFSGMRLAIVKRMAELMEGKLTAASRLGAGTVFDLELDVQEVRAEHGAVDETLATYELPPLILIAEDNYVNRLVAVKILERSGYRVITASTGADALHLWKAKEPDLVLLDVVMAGMDGLRIAHHIRNQERATGKYTPILAMASKVDKSLRDRCANSGFDNFLTKPFSPKLLNDAIKYALSIASMAKANNKSDRISIY